jgi:hypothetical protein
MKVDVDCVALGGNRPGSSAVPFGRKAAKRRQFGGELFLGHPGFLPFVRIHRLPILFYLFICAVFQICLFLLMLLSLPTVHQLPRIPPHA